MEMDQNYNNLITAFSELDEYSKKEEIVEQLDEMIRVFTSISDETVDSNNFQNTDFLNEVYAKLIVIKEKSTLAIKKVYDL